MWFQRVISWFRALFSALDESSDANEASPAGVAGYDALAPMSEPEFTRRQLLYPRDPLKTFGLGPTQDTLPLDTPLYESPKTIPLFRLSPQVDLRFDQPSQPLHVTNVTGEPPTPLANREPTQPATSEPLSANLQRLSEEPDALDSFDQMDDLDDMTRRLLFLRRLVRQRVYNEGFSLRDTPAQYRHSLGLSDPDDHPDSQN